MHFESFNRTSVIWIISLMSLFQAYCRYLLGFFVYFCMFLKYVCCIHYLVFVHTKWVQRRMSPSKSFLPYCLKRGFHTELEGQFLLGSFDSKLSGSACLFSSVSGYRHIQSYQTFYMVIWTWVFYPQSKWVIYTTPYLFNILFNILNHSSHIFITFFTTHSSYEYV